MPGLVSCPQGATHFPKIPKTLEGKNGHGFFPPHTDEIGWIFYPPHDVFVDIEDRFGLRTSRSYLVASHSKVGGDANDVTDTRCVCVCVSMSVSVSVCVKMRDGP